MTLIRTVESTRNIKPFFRPKLVFLLNRVPGLLIIRVEEVLGAVKVPHPLPAAAVMLMMKQGLEGVAAAAADVSAEKSRGEEIESIVTRQILGDRHI